MRRLEEAEDIRQVDIWRRALQIMRLPLSHCQRNSRKAGVTRTEGAGIYGGWVMRSGQKWRKDGGDSWVSALWA